MATITLTDIFIIGIVLILILLFGFNQILKGLKWFSAWRYERKNSKQWDTNPLKVVELTEKGIEDVKEKYETFVIGDKKKGINAICVGLVKGKIVTLNTVDANGLKAKVNNNIRALPTDCYYIEGLHKLGKVDLRSPLPFYLMHNDKPENLLFANPTTEDEDLSLAVDTTSSLMDSAFIEGMIGTINANKFTIMLYMGLGAVVTMFFSALKNIIIAGLQAGLS